MPTKHNWRASRSRFSAITAGFVIILSVVFLYSASATPVQPADSPENVLSSGTWHTCGLRSDGSVDCWGREEQAKDQIGPFTQISSGDVHTCGLRSDGSVDCWGSSAWVEDQAGPFTQVSVGYYFACGLKPDGSVDCWGYKAEGQDQAGPFTQISSGLDYTCALGFDGSAKCWGWYPGGQLGDHSGPYTQVSTGWWHACGLKTDGSADCWGSNNDAFGKYIGQAENEAGPFTQVTAGGFHSCGLKPNGSVVCWGANDNGQAEAQDGPFVQISAGYRHVCGLKPDGSVDCWGNNQYGQAEHQSGPYGPHQVVVELTGLEVTQAVQNLANDVELIANKTTYVRAHLRSAPGTTVFNFKGTLIGRRNGSELPGSPLAPSNLGGDIDVSESPQRQQLAQSLYFRLPPDWTTGDIELELEGVSHALNCQEVASTANDCKVSVSFLDTPRLAVSFIGIRWTDAAGTIHDPGDADYAAIVQDIEAQYPIHDLDWNNPTELDDWLNSIGPPQSSSGWTLTENVLPRLLGLRNLDGVTDRIYFGLLIDYVNNANLGVGYVGGWASTGFYRPVDPTTPAHEIGHNLGRWHSPCQTAADLDANYPYVGGHISDADTGDYAYFGFNSFSNEVLRPSVGDLMGYCRPRWVSDYTYEAMRSAIDTRWLMLDNASTIAETNNPAVLVSGFTAIEENTGAIESILQIEAPRDIMQPETGDYSIRFEDKAGQELASYSFNPSTPVDGDSATAAYSLLLPWVADTARIVLLREAEELAASEASSSVPSVSITSPQPGDMWANDSEMITWDAADQDGDNLLFTVQYRIDEISPWRTLTTAYEGNSYTIDRTKLPGSKKASLRVLVSDGFHTSSDSVEPFTVVANAPSVLIVGPSGGALFVEDQSIHLEGYGYDTEDGELADKFLTWESDLDGLLGTGKIVIVNAANLQKGTHQITLKATDSDGQEAAAATSIDIYRLRPVLPKQIAIAPSNLWFSVLAGSGTSAGQIVSIDNLGDGAIEWAAEADQPWITLSRTTGLSPETFEISVDATQLYPGEYEGNVTVIGTDSIDSPQNISVCLEVNGYTNFVPFAIRP